MKGAPQSPMTRLARQAADHAREGTLTLQVCEVCECVQYPYREVCRRCLSDRLQWQPVDELGRILAIAEVHASNEAWFRERAPWRIATVSLTAGPTVIAHLDAPEAGPDRIVRVRHTFIDPAQCVLVASKC